MTATPFDTLEVRISRAEERETIGRLAREAGVFTREEIDTVFELFDAAQNDQRSGYNFLSARLADQVVGFVCWGPTPLTEALTTFTGFARTPRRRGTGSAGRCLNASNERRGRKAVA